MKKNKTESIKIGRLLRLKPTKAQAAYFEEAATTCRILYNALLEYRRRQWQWLNNRHLSRKGDKGATQKFYAEWRTVSGFYADCKQITAILNDPELVQFTEFARKLPRLTLNIVAEGLDNAWGGWMKGKKGEPRFIGKNRGGSFTFQYGGTERILDRDRSTLTLSTKIGAVRYSDRYFTENGLPNVESPRIKRITITKNKIGEWYAAVLFEGDSRTRPAPEPVVTEKVGMDLGIAPSFAVFSNGDTITAPRFFEQSVEKLEKLQKKFSRQLRISNPDCFDESGKPIRGKRFVISNRAEATRKKIAALHLHISRQREHFLYNAANQIVDRYAGIVAEDMRISQMMQSGGGHYAIGKFSRGMMDASWGKFLEILKQRCNLSDRDYDAVPAEMTTRTCNSCGFESATPVIIREWICPKCKHRHSRKQNAAINVLKKSVL